LFKKRVLILPPKNLGNNRKKAKAPPYYCTLTKIHDDDYVKPSNFPNDNDIDIVIYIEIEQDFKEEKKLQRNYLVFQEKRS